MDGLKGMAPKAYCYPTARANWVFDSHGKKEKIMQVKGQYWRVKIMAKIIRIIDKNNKARNQHK